MELNREIVIKDMDEFLQELVEINKKHQKMFLRLQEIKRGAELND